MLSDLISGQRGVGTLRKPISIQFPVNDVCNSACQMCNIWQQSERSPITPDELDLLLHNDLFSDVRTVGLNGGEPTLRKDLGALAAVLAERLGKLQKIAIITNALHPPTVLRRIRDVRAALVGTNVGLDIMVSLDGWGDAHDRVRGKMGNFASALEVIDTIRAEKLADHLRIGSTIVKDNVLEIEELRYQLDRRDLPVNFRVGVPHRRLYIGPGGPFALDDVETDHLLRFLSDLASTAGNADERRIYRSIMRQIAYGAPRAVGCDFQGRAVTLTSRRQLALCPVVGDSIGPADPDTCEDSYFSADDELERVIATECDGCVHDYRGPRSRGATLAVAAEASGVAAVVERGRADLLRRPGTRRLVLNAAAAVDDARARVRPTGRQRVQDAPPIDALVLGWWGTETIGDQAILAGIARALEHVLPIGANIAVASAECFVTEESLRAIERPNWSAITIGSAREAIRTGRVRNALIGGGPLMSIRPLKELERLFVDAHRSGARTAIVGCGIGPVSGRWATSSIRNMLEAADFVGLRDEPSVEVAHALGSRGARLIHDPALWHVSTDGLTAARAEEVALAVRVPDPLYAPGRSPSSTSTFARELADAIDRTDRDFVAVPMHTYHVGGDDRWLLRDIAEHTDKVRFSWRRTTLTETRWLLAASGAVVAGRYHAFVLSAAAGTPTVALDYSGHGGKISSLAASLGLGSVTADIWNGVPRLGELLEASADLDWTSVSQELRARAATGRAIFESMPFG